jgi:hypothetical protein
VALIWNSRRHDTFLGARLDCLLRANASAYESIGHVGNARDAKIARFFDTTPWHHRVVAQTQELTLEDLCAYVRSVSYIPRDVAQSESMRGELTTLFRACSENGRVRMEYWTDTYLACLAPCSSRR